MRKKEPNKPNPPGHRAEAEKKTSPIVAAGILTTPYSDFFNTFSHLWTAPCWQGIFSTVMQSWSVLPSVRPVFAALFDGRWP
jgi:hypothetical protein